MKTLKLEKNSSICTVLLNRPKTHNAFDEELMKELYGTFSLLDEDDQIRVLILTGEGKSFCAGGDLHYMKSAMTKSHKQNLEESLYMLQMFEQIKNTSKPVIAYVNGATFGGGIGLVSVCDIVVAHEKAVFSLSEVKLGLTPAIISPFVIEKIGVRQARRYFLTGERFTAKTAKKIGLVHEVVTDQNKDEVLNNILENILNSGPKAVAEAKILIEKNRTLTGKNLIEFTAEQISTLRASDEAQEGITAFFEKRKAGFCKTK